MITIRRYGNVAEAGFAESLLISEGIEVFLADEEAGALGAQYVPWGMRLQVRQEDVDRALQILEEKETAAAYPVPQEEESNPPVICPNCGASLKLTGEDMERPNLACPTCGTEIPHETEISTLKFPPFLDWNSFLPRGDSKVVFIMAMTAYGAVLSELVTQVVRPLAGSSGYLQHIIGWGPVLRHLCSSLVLTPIWESLVLMTVIEALRRAGAPAVAQVVLSSAVIGIIDGFHFWPHGIEVVPFFIVSGYSYLRWRTESWRTAISVLVNMHVVLNSFTAVWLICAQIDHERISLAVTGDRYNWNRADALYVGSFKLLGKHDTDGAIQSLHQAISLYPYDHLYHWQLGVAYDDAGNQSDAEREFRKAVEMDGNDVIAWESLGYLLFTEQKFNESSAAYQNALAVAQPFKRHEIEGWIGYIELQAARAKR
jgi:hypothetical protein